MMDPFHIKSFAIVIVHSKPFAIAIAPVLCCLPFSCCRNRNLFCQISARWNSNWPPLSAVANCTKVQTHSLKIDFHSCWFLFVFVCFGAWSTHWNLLNVPIKGLHLINCWVTMLLFDILEMPWRRKLESLLSGLLVISARSSFMSSSFSF